MGWGPEKHSLVSGRTSLFWQHALLIEYPRTTAGEGVFGFSSHFSISRRAGMLPERTVLVYQNTPRARLWVSRGGFLAEMVLQLGRVIKRSTVSPSSHSEAILSFDGPPDTPTFQMVQVNPDVARRIASIILWQLCSIPGWSWRCSTSDLWAPVPLRPRLGVWS